MQLRRQSDGRTVYISTEQPLGKGGEAHVYAVRGHPDLAAKIYVEEKATEERSLKLQVMLANPPDLNAGAGGHGAMAWPTDLLCVPISTQAVGFLMPRVQNASEVIDLYNPQTRLETSPLFHYRYLLRAARNLAAAVRAVHSRGYVIGDLKHSNVLVTETALVTLVDTDSFQVRDPQTGRLFPCPVRTPDFTPPENQGKSPDDIPLTPEHDLFALGVLIFHLLMEGTHPFGGVFTGDGDPPPFEERIAQGHYPYGSREVPFRPATRQVPPFDLVPPPIRELFRLCFEEGHTDPAARPDARTWQTALDEAGRHLIACSDNPQHLYGDHLDRCAWCVRKQTQLRGMDPFPSEEELERLNQTFPPKPDNAPHAPTEDKAAPASTSSFVSNPAGFFAPFLVFFLVISLTVINKVITNPPYGKTSRSSRTEKTFTDNAQAMSEATARPAYSKVSGVPRLDNCVTSLVIFDF